MLNATITKVYLDQKLKDPSLPYIGIGFAEPRSALLRVMAIGINAYIGEDLWPAEADQMRRWFGNQEHKFYPAVHRDCRELAEKLAGYPIFKGKTFKNFESMYVTNAVKRFLPTTEGLHSDQLDDSHFEESEQIWHGELRELAGHGAFPQVIVIFGEPFWSRACETFKRSDLGFEVRGHRWVKSDRLHFANRYELNAGGVLQTTLLVRMDHPAARGERRTATWLLEDPKFVELLDE